MMAKNREHFLRSFLSLWIIVSFSFIFLLPSLSYADTASSTPLNDVDVNQFINTMNIIKKDYVNTINDNKLFEDAIRGMVNNLDPHSEYLDEKAYKSLLLSTNGAFGGVGIQVISQYDILKVIAPMDDSPAAKAGIKAGDYIVALNDVTIDKMTSDQAVNLMRGKEGTQVTLTILRKGKNAPLRFTLTRAIIHTDSVKSKMLESGYGYVRINQFQSATNDLLIKAINDLKKQSGGKLKGLILDLRNNPGGLLDTAISVANTFLDNEKTLKYNKLIVFTDATAANAKYQALAAGHDILDAAPLIVLINDGSASASEIVAGALQDYGRAIIVGETSFGKGSVQTIIPLDATHAVKLTTALYHTPSGRLIQNRGITPDIVVTEMKVNPADDLLAIDPLREFQLKDHLSNTKNSQAIEMKDKQAMSLALTDFQLYESLNILKTLVLSKNNTVS